MTIYTIASVILATHIVVGVAFATFLIVSHQYWKEDRERDGVKAAPWYSILIFSCVWEIVLYPLVFGKNRIGESDNGEER